MKSVTKLRSRRADSWSLKKKKRMIEQTLNDLISINID